MQVPLSGPDIGPREIELVNQVLSTPYLSIGPMIQRFEKTFAGYLGTKYAAGVNSGTSGLHLCIRIANIADRDEVITTPFSFIASANCILFERARPVFVDIDPLTLNIDGRRIEERITRRTKAILPVHIFGQPCQMDVVMDIARRHNLAVIEDACEAVGAEYKGRKVGTFGKAAVFAFYPNKQMTTGEGGMVVTDDKSWDALLRSLRNQGRGDDGGWLSHPRLGYNYRLDEMSSALGVAQMERIEELLSKRARVADQYSKRLSLVKGVQVPFIAPEVTRMSWFLYVVRLDSGIDRDRVQLEMEKRGIVTRPYFPPIHLQAFYQESLGYREGDFPITEAVSRSTLALPFYTNLEPEKVEYVCHNLEQVIA